MSILALMDRVHKKCTQQPHPFLNKQIALRRSYLTGVAMQAYADGVVETHEKELFLKIATAFDVDQAMAEEILDRATHVGEDAILELRDNLIDSKHKYYFILDLQIMAHQNAKSSPVEGAVIQRFGELLDIEIDDMDFLTELAEALIEQDPQTKEKWAKSFFKKLRIESEKSKEEFSYYLNGSKQDT